MAAAASIGVARLASALDCIGDSIVGTGGEDMATAVANFAAIFANNFGHVTNVAEADSTGASNSESSWIMRTNGVWIASTVLHFAAVCAVDSGFGARVGVAGLANASDGARCFVTRAERIDATATIVNETRVCADHIRC